MEKVAWLNSKAQAVILAHPKEYVQVYLDGLVSMFGPERDSIFYLLGVSPESNVGWVLLLIGWTQLLALYTLALTGVILAWRDPQLRHAEIVLLNFVLYFVAVAGPEVYARFRAPLMPFLAVLAGLGVWKLTMKIERRNIHEQVIT